MKRVLFVCTGNYYRSRFAELLFNAIAHQRGLDWHADSRGTDVFGAGRYNVGPISLHARQALTARGIAVADTLRLPLPLAAEDIADADLVIGVCEQEHRPQIERDFQALAERVAYWQIQDVEQATPEDALGQIEEQVRALAVRLSATP